MWPATTEGAPIRVLEADPDLGMGLTPADAAAAMDQLLAPSVSLDWDAHPHGWGPGDASGHFGLLVVEGLLLREVRLLGTASAELLGQGDLLRPWDVDGELDLPVPAEIWWTALEPVTVAVLDSDFVRRAASWPDVLSALAGRAVVRAKSMALHDAITNLKHVEVRLLVLFWHLAERWGRVGADSIALPLPLTHDTLAKLVGAARPSVTTALGALSERGLVSRDAGVWRLSRDTHKAFGHIPPAGDAR
jgi:CRP/FNR family transcriptional regulator, cyclic AMP receptor protein